MSYVSKLCITMSSAAFGGWKGPQYNSPDLNMHIRERIEEL